MPRNSVKRSFDSGNDYGNLKAKTGSKCDDRGCDAHVPVRQYTCFLILANMHYITPFCVCIGFTIEMSISGPIGVYFQNSRVRFFCPLPLGARVGRGFRRLGATCELNLGGLIHCLASHLFRYLVPVLFLLCTSDPLHRVPMRLCLGARVKVVYQSCRVVRRRETKVVLA